MPIYFRITVNGIEKEMSTQLKAERAKWSVEANRVTGKSDEARPINDYLEMPTAEKIVNTYQNDPDCLKKNVVLPVRSNQKTNEYLKEIAELCDIRIPLTFHVARHTFAITVTLSNKVPIETVSKMLAHEKIATTQQYAQVLDIKVSDDMNSLREKFTTV